MRSHKYLTQSQDPSGRNMIADHVVIALTVAGLIAALVMLVLLLESIQQQTKPGELYPSDVTKPALFYIAHAIQIVLLLGAAFVALISTDPRGIEPGYFWRFGLFMAAAVLMTARGYSVVDLFSTRLVDSTGPFPCLMSLLVFIGARRRYWNVIDRAIVAEAVFLSVIALIALGSLQSFTRDRVIASLGGTLNALYWPAAWIALRDYARESVSRHLRFVPILLYGFMSFFTETRLNVVMFIACLLVYAFLQYKRMMPQITMWIVSFGLVVWAGLFTAVFLTNTSEFRTLRFVAGAFAARLNEDTRTGQVRSFFNVVEPSELMLGRGALATWDWDRQVWRGGTDIGYLTLLFYGGLPLLLTYIAAHIRPAFTVFWTSSDGCQLAAAGIVLLWTLRMFSSSYPGLSLDYYPVVFCVGVCISRESDGSGREVYRPPREIKHARPLVY